MATDQLLRSLFVQAVEDHEGQRFEHHFSPDLCQNGTTTVDGCFEKGLGPTEFDCSGLVVASLCEVLGLDSRTDWPWEYRHGIQMSELAEEGRLPRAGDVSVTQSWDAPWHVVVHLNRHEIGEAVSLEGVWRRSSAHLWLDGTVATIPLERLVAVVTDGQ